MPLDPSNLRDTTFATTGQVQRAVSLSDSELRRMIDRLALDPTVFETRPPFFWRAEISSNRLDAYYTRMADSTLRNFAEDATAGVGFQNSHNTNELGLGRSINGAYIGAQRNTVARVEADFYTVPGLTLGRLSTNDFIDGVRSGILTDVSVGFFGGAFRCSVCGRDLWDWDCTHIPGVEYDKIDPATGAVIGTDTAFAWIDNARLAEVSVVYDGATPGAAILKATQEAQQGRMNEKQRSLLETRYRMRLPAARVQVPGVDGAFVPSEGGELYVPVPTRLVAPTVAPVAQEAAMPQETTPQEETRATPTLVDVVDAAADVTPEGTPPIPAAVENPEPTATVEAPAGDVLPGDLADSIPLVAQAEADQRRESEGAIESARTANALTAGVVHALTMVGMRATADPEEGLRQLTARIQQLTADNTTLAERAGRVAGLESDLERLRPLADMGTQYRTDLISETLAEGLRAFGGEFSEETYRGVLAVAPLDTIKRMREDFQRMGNKLYPGGRQTITETPAGGDEAPETPAAPAARGGATVDAAYRA